MKPKNDWRKLTWILYIDIYHTLPPVSFYRPSLYLYLSAFRSITVRQLVYISIWCINHICISSFGTTHINTHIVCRNDPCDSKARLERRLKVNKQTGTEKKTTAASRLTYRPGAAVDRRSRVEVEAARKTRWTFAAVPWPWLCHHRKASRTTRVTFLPRRTAACSTFPGRRTSNTLSTTGDTSTRCWTWRSTCRCWRKRRHRTTANRPRSWWRWSLSSLLRGKPRHPFTTTSPCDGHKRPGRETEAFASVEREETAR